MPPTTNRAPLHSAAALPTAARPYQADQPSPGQFEPLLVTTRFAKNTLQIGNTKFWQLVKLKKILMADTGGRRMVVYASLKALAQPSA